MDRILIIGSNGQLGTSLQNVLKDLEIYSIDYPKYDICNLDSIYSIIKKYKPNIIINAAAYTNVSKAEIESEKALNINALALKRLSEICNYNNIKLYHISTSYVFNGKKNNPYIESDYTDPLNIYGLSKYLGEKIVKEYCNSYLIIRTSDLYGISSIDSNNIIEKIISFAKANNYIKLVVDEFTSPTSTDDVAKQIKAIINNTKDLTGIVHMTCEGICNWYEFGKYILEKMNMEVDIQKVLSSQFTNNFKKPKYYVLENYKLKKNEINNMPHWKTSFDNYYNNYLK